MQKDISMSRILVTGGNGFLGSHVCDMLKLSAPCITYASPSSKECDLTKNIDTEVLFYNLQPEVVIHLAAVCGGIGANQINPGKYFYDNILMGLNVIENSRKFNVKKLIFVSTVCSYPKYCQVPFREEDIWNGYPEETNAPYGVAKKSLQVMLKAYHEQYGLKSITLLPANLYGPRDNFNPKSSHVIPALINKIDHAISNNLDCIEVWGDGSATREFLYVKDAAESIISAINSDIDCDYFNIGTGDTISIKNLVKLLCKIMNYEGKIIWDTTKPNGQPKRQLNVNKANNLLNWKSKTNLTQGLKETVEWWYAR